MSEEIEKKVAALELENQNLKSQLANNAVGVNQLMAQLEAFKGELADARTISFQLRSNLVMANRANQDWAEKVKSLEALLAAKDESKAPQLKEVAKGK